VNGALDVIETIGEAGDLIGFSLSEMMPGIEPSDTGLLMDDMASITTRSAKNSPLWSRGGVR